MLFRDDLGYIGEAVILKAHVLSVAQSEKPEPSCDHSETAPTQRHRASRVVSKTGKNVPQMGASNWLRSQCEPQTWGNDFLFQSQRELKPS